MEKEDKKSGEGKPAGSENIGGDISILKQLVDSLDESEKKLEDAYKKNDAESLNKAKKFMADVTKKISEAIK